MLGDDTAALADELQARSMRALLREERRANGAKIAALVKTATGQPDSHQIRRAIRQLENDIQQVDRMLAALARRFPEAVGETG